MGTDFAGIVVQVGPDVPAASVKLGDHVAGFTQGGNYTDRGAYAAYVKASWDLVWKIPEPAVSYEEASTFGCA